MNRSIRVLDAFLRDMERDAGQTAAQLWCNRNADTIHAAYTDMMAERAADEARLEMIGRAA